MASFSPLVLRLALQNQSLITPGEAADTPPPFDMTPMLERLDVIADALGAIRKQPRVNPA